MPRPLKSILVPALCASTFLGLSGSLARAADVPPPPANWWDTIAVSGTVDAGITFNPDSPGDGLNFGHLFTDKANEPLLNQMVLTVQRPLDPKAPDYDFGFKVQVMYGTDARYTHYLGELDYIINDWSQLTPVEAWGIVHLPWLFAGGIDVKAGQYVTLEGAETIDPTTNYLYSHSYIFNFGIPLVHTGIMTISHVDPMVDIYAGVDTGVNTTFGNGQGDNNGAAAFHGGIGLNLLDGKLTILATTHIGPEIPDTNGTNNTVDFITACACNPNSALRFLNDITVTWKATDALTFITDGNFIHDDAFSASGYGVAQYAIYAVTDWLKLVGRAEIWRDNGSGGAGFFVGAFPGNFDFVNAEHGFLNTSFVEAPTTYLELTAGLNISTPIPNGTPVIKSLTFRPEVRYDSSLNGTTPFDGQGGILGIPGTPGFGVGTKSSQVTFGGDIIATF